MKHNPVYILVYFALVCTDNSTISSAASIPKTGCYQCNTLMCRDWRHNLEEKCSGTKADCGSCISGYSAQSQQDKCEESRKITVHNYQTRFIPNGASVILPCTFLENVNCVWQRRGMHLDIKGRYKYIGNVNEAKTIRNCSIQIEPYVADIDYGKWTCESMSTSVQYGEIASTVNLINDDKVKIYEGRDVVVHAQLGESLIIKCSFNKFIDCGWTRNSHQVDIRGRYSYVNGNGRNTEDCTIRINSISEIDFNTWQCESMADSSHWAIHSTTVHLIHVQVQTPSIVIKPEKTTALLGGEAIFECTFDADVLCHWHRNGNEVEIVGSYRYIEEGHSGVRRNCGIKIANMTDADVGEWKCYYEGSPAVNQTNQNAWLTVIPEPTTTRVTPKSNNMNPKNLNSQGITNNMDNGSESHTIPLETSTIVKILILVSVLMHWYHNVYKFN